MLNPYQFQAGQQISAAQLNEIVRAVLQSLNITCTPPLQMTKSVAGCHLSMGAIAGSLIGHGTLGAALTVSGGEVDCTLYAWDGSADTSTGNTVKVRCPNGNIFPYMGSGTWVEVYQQGSVKFAYPMARGGYHGQLTTDMGAGSGATMEIYNGASATGKTISVADWCMPASSIISSGHKCIAQYDIADGSYRLVQANTCPATGG